MKINKIIFLTLIFSLVAAGQLFAFKITPALKQEIIEKQKFMKKNYDAPHAHFDLAVTYAYTNHVAEGWEELKKVNQLDPGYPPLALDLYKAKVALAPFDWKLRYRLAFALYFNGKKKSAISQFKKIIKQNPAEAFSYGYLGLIYGEIGQVDTAIKYIKQGIAIDSDIAALHLLLSQAYYKKGEAWNGFKEGGEAIRLKALGY